MKKLPSIHDKIKAKSVYASGLACRSIFEMDYEDLRFTLGVLMEQLYKRRIENEKRKTG